MKKIKDVWFNRGRWLVRCPICESKNEIKPNAKHKQIKFFCGGCYPDKQAREPKIMPDGRIILSSSMSKQKAAAQNAHNNNEIYIAVLPDEWVEVQELLRLRRTPHQGYYPGNFKQPNHREETIQDLRDEQKNDKLLAYVKGNKRYKKEEIKSSQKTVQKTVQKEEITDKFFRSLQ